jgi:pyridoxal phosphate phosphatase PHOSPHO2
MDSSPSMLFVWDFDETIVLANTDTLVFERLSPSLLPEILNAASPRPSWTARIDAGLSTLAEQGHTPAAILAAAADAPLPPDTLAALTAIAAHPAAASAVLSDANSLYISSVLARARLDCARVFAAGIFTNPARIVPSDVPPGGAVKRVTVAPYCGERMHGCVVGPHGCPRCPKNICKGELLDALVARYGGGKSKVVVCYIGDGGNDACPAARVRAGGVVLPRKGFTLEHRICGLPGQGICGQQAAPQVALQTGVDIRAWETPTELLAHVEAMLAGLA